MGQEITSKQYAEKIVELAYYNFPLVHPKETVIKCVDALVKEYADQQTKHLNDRLKKQEDEIVELKLKLNISEVQNSNEITDLNKKLDKTIAMWDDSMKVNNKLQTTISEQQETITELESINKRDIRKFIHKNNTPNH